MRSRFEPRWVVVGQKLHLPKYGRMSAAEPEPVPACESRNGDYRVKRASVFPDGFKPKCEKCFPSSS